jgi:hypothetical protein
MYMGSNSAKSPFPQNKNRHGATAPIATIYAD